ncbi:uncharacterized protein LOC135494101 [Lineus longissimus]|uniref:uncharacterized protein LOC135494101 n=1 Tax=Lineus longissimus TaxID=88925 RepID=UPI00315CAA0A
MSLNTKGKSQLEQSPPILADGQLLPPLSKIGRAKPKLKSKKPRSKQQLPKIKTQNIDVMAEGMDFSRGEGKLYFDGHESAAASLQNLRSDARFTVEPTQLSPPPDSQTTDLESLIANSKSNKIKKALLVNSAALTFSQALASKGREGRFKKLARMVKANLLWSKESDDKDEGRNDNQSFVVTNTENGQTETVSFNPTHYKAQGRTYGGLTASTKKILLTNQDDRTEEDLEVLKRIVDRLKCFEKYSTKVRQEMARVVEYDSFDDGKVIIKQGHIGISFYFIFSGAVRVLIRETDKNTGISMSHCIGELTEGSTFGELALLHNITRTATIICKGHSEFLRVDKEDFDMVLRRSYEYEYNQRVAGLKNIQLFRDLKDDEIEAMANNCKSVEYVTDQVIIGNTKAISENVYFIKSGSAIVIRQMIIIREQFDNGHVKYHFPSSLRPGFNVATQNARARRPTRMSLCSHMIEERHLMSLCKLRSGSYFGVGEDLMDTFVVSAEKTEVIMVPRVLFVKYGQPKMLERMRIDWETVLPDMRTTFNRYIEDKKWRAYRQEVVDEVISRRRSVRCTRIEDVPLSFRLNLALSTSHYHH